jgi:hypothetical protein
MFNLIFLKVAVECSPEILMFGLAFAVALMIMSRVWNRRVYSIFAVGVWLFLMTEVSADVPLVIICIGLMLEELWYAFIAQADN